MKSSVWTKISTVLLLLFVAAVVIGVYLLYLHVNGQALPFDSLLSHAEEVSDEDDLDVNETKAEELWSMISDARLSREQQDKYHGYTWERARIDKNMDDDEIARLGGIMPVRITVKWADNRRGDHEEESYVALWRKPEK